MVTGLYRLIFFGGFLTIDSEGGSDMLKLVKSAADGGSVTIHAVIFSVLT